MEYTWQDLRDVGIRHTALNDDICFLAGNKHRGHFRNNKVIPNAVVINLEFAKTMDGQIRDILKELGVL